MATRILLARHGVATYETALVTDDGGSLTAEGRAQARSLADRAAGVVAVWCSPASRAVQTAEIAAAALGVDVTVREGLREYGVGALAGTDGSERDVIVPVFERWAAGDDAATIPGGEVVAAIAARMVATLTEVADRYDGRGVLVVGHGGAIRLAVPVLLGRPRPTGRDLALAGGDHLELVRDRAGWTLRDVPRGP